MNGRSIVSPNQCYAQIETGESEGAIGGALVGRLAEMT
jgi:hypothetical protein